MSTLLKNATHYCAAPLPHLWHSRVVVISRVFSALDEDDDLVFRSQFSSVQFSSVSSIVLKRKSQWKASLKRWVLSPARNWLRLMVGERRWSGSEFQTTGAAMKKLRLPSLVVLVRGTNRSPCSAERRPGRLELSATVQTIVTCIYARIHLCNSLSLSRDVRQGCVADWLVSCR